MNNLDALGKALRDELGEPPVEWQEQQRRRLRSEQVGPPRRPQLRWATAVVLACALLGIGYFGFSTRDSFLAVDDGMSSQWLDATSSGLPFRAPDGSSIQLEQGSRGRFSSNEVRSQFDLHGGRATFEVTKRQDQDWTVVAGRYSLHVIGTRFTVSYQEGKLGVWVDEGRVGVSVAQRSDPVLLEAGDELQAEGDQLTLKTRNDATGKTGAHPVAGTSEHGSGGAPESEAQLPPADSASAGQVTTPGSRVTDRSLDWHEFYVKGQYVEALRAAKQIGFEPLTHKLDASKLVDLADAARLGGDSSAALKALRALESRFAAVATTRDSDFLIARLHAQRGETSAAIRRFTVYLERGEGARYSLEALGRLIELHARMGDNGKARPLARRYLERAPNGPYHRLAESVIQQR